MLYKYFFEKNSLKYPLVFTLALLAFIFRSIFPRQQLSNVSQHSSVNQWQIIPMLHNTCRIFSLVCVLSRTLKDFPPAPIFHFATIGSPTNNVDSCGYVIASVYYNIINVWNGYHRNIWATSLYIVPLSMNTLHDKITKWSYQNVERVLVRGPFIIELQNCGSVLINT